MKRFLLIVGLVLVSTSLWAGCQTMSSNTEDARITAAIKSKLAEEQFDLSRVGVDTGNAHVYLSGVVPSSDHKARVEQIANGILEASPAASYGSVINRLQIRPVISDVAVTSSVKGLLMTDRMINASQIGVETQQGIVSLNGFVPSQEQKLRAELLTRDIQGVRQVVNNLQVTMVTPAPNPAAPIQDDSVITATIKEKLMVDRLANLASRANEVPLNVYGYSKSLFDAYVRRVLPERTAQLAGFRYFNVYGPREAH